MNSFKKELFSIIRIRLKAKGLSLKDLGYNSKQALDYRVKNGKINIKEYFKIKEMLEIDIFDYIEK